MRARQVLGGSLFIVMTWGSAGSAATVAAPATHLDQVLDAVIANESKLADTLVQYRPLVETYFQTVKPDSALGRLPVKDNYFLGRLEIPRDLSDEGSERSRHKAKTKESTLNLFDDFHSATFKPDNFARMLILDRGAFDREHYEFEFLRAEFLGEVRTLVFDVIPRPGKALNRLRTGRFTGRIWVEDRDYNVVRYNGLYASALTVNFHFDCWRMEMAPGLWLPAYVYTEEAEAAFKQIKLTHKGQVRIWGYRIERDSAEEEFTKVLIDTPQARDRSEAPGQVSPIASARAWEGEAEENVLRRLERAGLLAPSGPVDKVLETVMTNLQITSGLEIEPPVRCRVLLTTPLESFTVGHTIVLSRGLIDVLPDEPSLAMVIAHELGHVLSGHELDTRFAFSDRVLGGDRQTMEKFDFQRDPAEEAQADVKAIELLETSPYKDKLAAAGLFLKALESRAEALPALIRPHFGNGQLRRMSGLVAAAPALDPTSTEQIAALPLGGRVQLDPWSARIALMKNAALPVLTSREKLPFQITPLRPNLARHGARTDAPFEDAAQAPVGEVREDGPGGIAAAPSMHSSGR